MKSDKAPSRVPLLLRALYSDAALKAIYARRKAEDPDAGVRSQINAIIAMGLLIIVFSVLVVAAWVPQNISEYIKSRDQLLVVESGDQTWRATKFAESSCEFPAGCHDELSNRSELASTTTTEIDELANPDKNHRVGLIRIEIQPEAFAPLDQLRAFVLSLPSYRYYRAAAFVDGKVAKTFLLSERINLNFETANQTGRPLVVDFVFVLDSEQRTFAGVRNGESMMVASQGEYNRFVAFLSQQRTGATGAVGMVAKIAVALFCLLLFLVIDSSPESLGLGLFMGFEAAAMAIGQGWLPLGPLAEHKTAIGHFCWQSGDLMKLYFLLQIARVARPKAGVWLIATVALSLPYGFFMQWAAQNGMNWIWQIPRSRDTIVGVVGGIACLRAFWFIRNEALPWRKAALLIAGAGGFLEVLASWTAHSTAMQVIPIVQTIYTVLQGNIGYLFAVSTFLNISTLENRVRALSKSQVRAKELERELDIARMVQRSLLVPPRLPRGISLSCYQEAALYVSGDTYFVNWDRKAKRFTFMLNDVTGHGIQAALKASACNILAKTIWHDAGTGVGARASGENLRRFDELSKELLVESGNIPDFNSMIAAEFDIDTKLLSIYRSNFSFPILIRPVDPNLRPDDPILGEFWNIAIVPTANQTVTPIEIHRGTFMMFLSDGFLESSRDLKKFTAHLRQKLSSRNGLIDVNTINEIALRYEGFAINRNNDDRTILVFQWEFAEAAEGQLPQPLPANQ